MPFVVLFDVTGSVGTLRLGLSSVDSTAVRSPEMLWRHAKMLGAFIPTSARKRSSRNRSCAVWSKVSEHTQPPALKGETTSIGTRTPKPMGPESPPASDDTRPALPGGANGGGTWSKNSSFSSWMMNDTVLAHTSGFDINVARTCELYHSPGAGGAGGVRHSRRGG